LGAFETGHTTADRPATSATPVGSAGFGGAGVAPRANAAAPVPSVGVFSESVAARAASRGSAAPVASGFGSQVAVAVPQSRRQRDPASTKFESVAVNVAPASSVASAGSVERYKPVEILQKPRPAYSEEARRLQIEGEVVLEALFSASGQIRVVRVVHSLGHGLDECAIQAAGAIRFRPAAENGKPLDTMAILKIAFQLAY
jgi:TonB family protein